MLAQPLLFCDFYLLGLMRLSVFYNKMYEISEKFRTKGILPL